MHDETTSIYLRDTRGVRLVIGQNVYSASLKTVGQLMGIAQRQGTCTVRFGATGAVVTLPAKDLCVATWEQVRDHEVNPDTSRLAKN
jgi:hypothetical protein